MQFHIAISKADFATARGDSTEPAREIGLVHAQLEATVPSLTEPRSLF